MNRFISPRPPGRPGSYPPRGNGWRRRRWVAGIVAVIVVIGFAARMHRTGMFFGAPALASHPLTPFVSTTMKSEATDACMRRAARAQTIAKDRDAGVPHEQEMAAQQKLWNDSPAEHQLQTLMHLKLVVDGIYGPYAGVPASHIYDKYLQYCKSHSVYGSPLERP